MIDLEDARVRGGLAISFFTIFMGACWFGGVFSVYGVEVGQWEAFERLLRSQVPLAIPEGVSFREDDVTVTRSSGTGRLVTFVTLSYRSRERHHLRRPGFVVGIEFTGPDEVELQIKTYDSIEAAACERMVSAALAPEWEVRKSVSVD